MEEGSTNDTAVDGKWLFGMGSVSLDAAIGNLERGVWYRVIRKADPHLAHRVAEYERTGLDI